MAFLLSAPPFHLLILICSELHIKSLWRSLFLTSSVGKVGKMLAAALGGAQDHPGSSLLLDSQCTRSPFFLGLGFVVFLCILPHSMSSTRELVFRDISMKYEVLLHP